MSSQLLFKVVAHSYCRYHDQNNIMEDCLSAITNQIQKLDEKISTEVKQIAEVLSLQSEPAQNEMSIIIQQQSQRSFHENQHEYQDEEEKKYTIRQKDKNSRMSYEKKMNKMKQKHNVQVRKINKMQVNMDKLIGIYKSELLQISKLMTQSESNNKQLKQQNKKILKQKKQLKAQISELKDQITIQSAKFLLAQPQLSQSSSSIPTQMEDNIQSVFSYDPKISKKQITQKQESVFKYKIKSQSQRYGIKQDSRVCQQKNPCDLSSKAIRYNNNINENDEGSSKISKQKKRERKNQEDIHENKKEIKTKQIAEDMEKWKKLSKKIEELKTKLLAYEQEREQKEQTIKKLRQQIKQLKAGESNEEQEKRRIKTSNTTLRGQKTVLLNQINSLKKQLVQKSQFSSLMQVQNIQLKKQVQNFCQTIKWQSNAIQQLNQAIRQKQIRNSSQSTETINTLQRVNDILYKALCEQQEHMVEMEEKTKNIQQLYDQKRKGMRTKVAELEMILDEKNEQIIKMKSKNNHCHGIQNVNPNMHNGYLGQLVKVLTKKVADRDQIIRRFEER